MKIAVDVASGENTIETLVQGCLEALAISKTISLILVGDQSRIERVIAKEKKVDKSRIKIVHTLEVIGMDETPTKAIKSKHEASVLVAARLVGRGEAHGFFSPGNTGATLASSLMEIGRLKGIQRPALLTLAPSAGGDFCILDVGANSDCSAEYLVQFAVMGDVFAKRYLKIRNPKIGLLNIGEEEGKGNATVKKAYDKLSKLRLNFVGNIEPSDMFKADSCDVLVCDGFDGNILLKTIESTAKFMLHTIKDEMKKNPSRLIGAKLMQPVFGKVKENLNPDTYGAAVLMGVKGGAFVGHGKTTQTGIKNAILSMSRFLEEEINKYLLEEINEMGVKKGIF